MLMRFKNFLRVKVFFCENFSEEQLIATLPFQSFSFIRFSFSEHIIKVIKYFKVLLNELNLGFNYLSMDKI